MRKNKGFINALNRSTKITMLSCICFVALTVLILVFFILFPITPSEKIMASIGRENIFNGNDVSGVVTTSPAVSTSVVTAASTAEKSTTKPVSTTTRTYKINITTGSGFMYNGRIPTGVTGYEATATTPADYPQDPTYPNVDPTAPPVDPSIPPVDTGTGYEPPVSTPPVDPYDPPVTPEPPADGGSNGNGDDPASMPDASSE